MSTYIIRPVVVGVDGSPGSLAALRFAAAEADARDRTLRIVHAIAWPGEPPDAERPHAPHLSSLADRIIVEAINHAEAAFPGLAVDAHAVFGSPAAVLLDESDHAALVVVGCRGRGGFAGLLAGSTSTQVATHARKPVVVVRGETAPPGAAVLLGVDPGDPAAAAIEFGFEEAALRAAPLRVFFGWSAGHVLSHTARPGGFEAATEEAGRQLTEALTRWQEKYPAVRVVRDAVHTLDPANALVRASHGAALTVVGAHRRSELRQLLLGSCAYQLVHRAASPVAVVSA
jgi:nucleotide-binding universal stress UspA family protein